jgi:hypothetical protein
LTKRLDINLRRLGKAEHEIYENEGYKKTGKQAV